MPATFCGIPKRVPWLQPFPYHPQVVQLCFGIRSGLFIAMRLLQPPDRTYSTFTVVFCSICGRYISWRLENRWRTEGDISPTTEMSNVSTPKNGRMPNGYGSLPNKVAAGLADSAFCLAIPSLFGSLVESLTRRSLPRGRPTTIVQTWSYEYGLDTTRIC